jgi:large repetitive protein
MLKTLVGGQANTTAGKLSFNTIWKTDNAGTSTSSQITVPTNVAGSYNCTVYWGDGTSNTITTYNDAAWTHTYPAPGVYLVEMVGTVTGLSFNNGGDRLKFMQILNWGGFGFGAVQATFFGCANLTITATDIPSLTGMTTMNAIFRNCTSIRTIPNIDSWPVTTSITNIVNNFNGATLFNSPVGSWNTSAVISFQSNFSGASSFNQPLSSWITASATQMLGMFTGATAFNQDISSWNTANVTNMQSMFQNATSFNQNISGWNTGKVTNMSLMFSGATSFNQNLGAWNITKLVSGATGGTNMFTGVTLSNANYNGLLAGWGSQVPLTGVTFNGGNSHYDTTSGGFNGTAGRAVLTGTYSWVITDAGTP